MIPPGPIKAITFDVGGTLLEPWPSVGHVYAQIAANHGLPGLSAPRLNQQFACAWSALKDFNYSRHEWAMLVKETFHGLTEAPPGPELFSELYSHFAQAKAWRLFEDVLPTLDALASHGYKLGVISNWDERLRPLLRQFRLLDYFEAIIISSEVAFAKPSPVIFELAAQKLALPPSAILHVGDSLEADAQGARAAGAQALWLRRENKTAAPGEISSLKELTELY
jgi:putative hydrolase of the HAD superfamily